jgi:hypothetical protein
MKVQEIVSSRDIVSGQYPSSVAGFEDLVDGNDFLRTFPHSSVSSVFHSFFQPELLRFASSLNVSDRPGQTGVEMERQKRTQM